MVQINFASKEVNCKVVYYGPGMSGKTTNLEIVHQKAPEEHKGDLTSISTDGDRTLFFDFMPLDLGKIAGMQTKFQLYTVPGQVYYNSTRKLVLQGVDGVIFVADSDPTKMDENIESYQNLIDNLEEYGKDVRELPHVIQYNKRDLPNALSVEEADKQLNRFGVPTFEAVANSGEGVFPTLKTLAGMVLESINKQEKGGGRPARKRAQAPAKAPQSAPPQSEPVAAPAPQRPARAAAGSKVRSAGGRTRQKQGGSRRQPQQVQPRRQVPVVQAQQRMEAKSEGKGFLVAFLVLLIAAVAGVAYVVLGQGV
ncbi:MAG: hypothetical protein CSA62_13915 [Planctomycetota bacterium]|nr:MAG: hypothetical protein CSA62_13915 [Planctomycetota bacterium]